MTPIKTNDITPSKLQIDVNDETYVYIFYVHNHNYRKYLLIRNAKAGNGLINTICEMTTDEMLTEIAKYKYDSYVYKQTRLVYSQTFKDWRIEWADPIDFDSASITNATTPNESCKKGFGVYK